MKHSKDLSKQIEDLRQLLSSVGLKITEQRMAIMYLLRSEHGPFTVEEIASKLQRKKSTTDVNTVTIYRCLEKFEGLGLVRRCEFGDGFSRYEIMEIEGSGHHHHIICRSCKRVDEVELCPLNDIKQPFRHLGYKDISHRLEFFGLCQRCDRKSS